MNFDFSEDQKFLGDQARKYLSEQCTTAEVRKVLNDDGMACHESLWNGIAEMGWLGTAAHSPFHIFQAHSSAM